ncbi:MAG TPA: glycosyltransferase [Vicinamibacterales bacterium]|nr:glycosyltransferase [Vicinamibacterales bacterium]
MSAPLLSIVVTVIDGGSVLRDLLASLTTQRNSPRLQIIVPYDASIAADTEAVAKQFASSGVEIEFLPLGKITPVRPIESAAGQHELYDRRRSAGLHAAKGDLIAIIEDRGVPRADWASTAVRLHEQPFAVIGGAINGARGTVLNWAFYVCDFGRYGLPFESGPAEWVSDVNVTYKRRVIDDTRDLWKERFREPIVHWALIERGETLHLSSELVVEHRRPHAPLSVLLPERFHWGRLFGHIRAMHMSLPKRLAASAMWPLLPPMLFVRHARTQFRKGNFGRFVRAAPAVAILLVAWTSGEVWGYLTNRS